MNININEKFNEYEKLCLQNPEFIYDKMSYFLSNEDYVKSKETLGLIHFFIGSASLYRSSYTKAIKELFIALDYFEECKTDYYIGKSYYQIGNVYSKTNNYEKAVVFVGRGLKKFVEVDKENEIGLCYGKLACLYSDLNISNKVDKNLEILKNHMKNITAPDYSLIFHNAFAYVYIGENKYKEALMHLEKALSYYYKVEEKMKVPLDEAVLLINIGEAYMNIKEYELSEKFLTEGIEKGKNIKSNYILEDAYKQICKLYECQGNYEKALGHYKQFNEYNLLLTKEIQNKHFKELAEAYETEKRIRENEIFRLKNIELREKTVALEEEKFKLQRSKNQLKLISEIGKRITSESDFKKCYELFFEEISKLVNIKYVGIGEYRPEKNMIVYDYIMRNNKKIESFSVPLDSSKSYSARCFIEGRDLYLPSISDEDLQSFGYLRLNKYSDQISDKYVRVSEVHSGIFCLLKASNEKLGVIMLQSIDKNAFSLEDFEMVKALSAYLSIALYNAKQSEELKVKNQSLKYLSYHDPLTGLYNRRYLDHALDEIQTREHTSIGIINGDIDNLKKVNDSFGHLYGDKYIKKVGKILSDACKNDEVIIRMSGDEFMIIKYDATEENTQALMKDIYQRCDESSCRWKVGISLGHSIQEGLFSQKMLLDLYKQSEENMYKEKEKHHTLKR